MRLFKLALILCIIGMIPVIYLVARVIYVAHVSHQKEEKELVGLYVIDLSELGTHDIYIDKNLNVELKRDRTFKLTHAIRNVYATEGTWSPATGAGTIDAEAPNDICYGLDKPRCCHITRCFVEGTDTSMYMGILFNYEKFHTPLTLKFKKISSLQDNHGRYIYMHQVI